MVREWVLWSLSFKASIWPQAAPTSTFHSEDAFRKDCFAVLRGWRQRELDHWRLELPRTPYRIWLEKIKDLIFHVPPKKMLTVLIYQTAITMWARACKKGLANGQRFFWGLQLEGFHCFEWFLMWQFRTSMLKKSDTKQFLGCHVLFFFDGDFCLLISEFKKKKHDVLYMFVFFLVSGTTGGTSLVGLGPGYLRPPGSAFPAAGGAGAGAAITGAMEAEKTEKTQEEVEMGPGPRPRVAGETPGRGEVFFLPRRFFFFPQKRGLDIFFLNVCVVFFWFEVGLYGPTQRARERAWKWFYFIIVKYSDKICIILRKMTLLKLIASQFLSIFILFEVPRLHDVLFADFLVL